MDFDTLKSSSSNFDKLTKALEQNLAPEDLKKRNPIRTKDYGNQN